MEDTSQEIVVLASGPKLIQPPKPKRKAPRWAWIAAAVVAFLVICCGGFGLVIWSDVQQRRPEKRPYKVVEKAPAYIGPHKAKLDAALAIQYVDERDAALAKLAEEAASRGDVFDGALVMNALREVRFIDFHDKLAATCALRLAKNGKYAEATEIAKEIRFNDLRDTVLNKLARGGT